MSSLMISQLAPPWPVPIRGMWTVSTEFLRTRADDRQTFGQWCESKSLTRRWSNAVLRNHVDNLDVGVEGGNKYRAQFRRRAACGSLVTKIAPHMWKTSPNLRGESPASPGRSFVGYDVRDEFYAMAARFQGVTDKFSNSWCTICGFALRGEKPHDARHDASRIGCQSHTLHA